MGEYENVDNKEEIATLLVDDYQETFFVVDTLLNNEASRAKYFYNIEFENSPMVAVEKFKKDPLKYKLLITDYEMPYIKGDEVIATLRKLNPDIKVIAISAWLDSYSKQNSSLIKEIFESSEPPTVAIEKPFPADFDLIVDSVIDGTNEKNLYMASTE